MILKGDCIEVMKAMKPNSVDAIVCDPPYGLEFMGKEWDKLWDSRNKDDQSNEGIKTFLRAGKNLTAYKAGLDMQIWHTQWLTEAYRVLKPGGSLLAMGGSRTSHRLACAIEDTGFIIKDTLMFIYGSGFPKCQDITPMIDGKVLGITTKQVKERREVIGIKKHSDNFNNAKANKVGYLADPANRNNKKCFGYGEEKITQSLTPEAKHWDGFKVGGIKPAYEPIIWAVKPPEGSYVDNVLKWGVGAVNVDECRVGTDINRGDRYNGKPPLGEGANIKFGKREQIWNVPKGRFPANVILSHHPECVQVGVKKVKGLGGSGRASEKGRGFQTEYVAGNKKAEGFSGGFVDKDGYEQMESWDCHPDCAVRLLDEQSGNIKTGGAGRCVNHKASFYGGGRHMSTDNGGDSGGASRFFYCAKASRGERNAGLEGMEDKAVPYSEYREKYDSTKSWVSEYSNGEKRPMNKLKNIHPTVKPIKLFEWLIKLVTREGQIVLDPFIGSGTTAIAAHNTGRKCIGIEKEGEYLEIAKRRIEYWESQPKQMEIR